MYHSVTFGTKNCWDDWGIVPTSRPVINPPSVKEKTIDIPGGNGVIDLTESLTGYPVYNNRTGSLEFIVVDQETPWNEIYSSVMNYLHGKRMTLVLEDEPDYYYEGRFSVNSWKSEKDWSRITIDYNLSPYKRSRVGMVNNWEWDPFSFTDGVIPDSIYRNIAINAADETEIILAAGIVGTMRVCPTFAVRTASGEGAIVRYINERTVTDVTKTLPEGTSQTPDIILSGDTATIYAKSVSGTGSISIDFAPGWL